MAAGSSSRCGWTTTQPLGRPLAGHYGIRWKGWTDFKGRCLPYYALCCRARGVGQGCLENAAGSVGCSGVLWCCLFLSAFAAALAASWPAKQHQTGVSNTGLVWCVTWLWTRVSCVLLAAARNRYPGAERGGWIGEENAFSFELRPFGTENVVLTCLQNIRREVGDAGREALHRDEMEFEGWGDVLRMAQAKGERMASGGGGIDLCNTHTHAHRTHACTRTPHSTHHTLTPHKHTHTESTILQACTHVCLHAFRSDGRFSPCTIVAPRHCSVLIRP